MRTARSAFWLVVAGILGWSCTEEAEAPLAPGAAVSLFRGEESAYLYSARDSSAEVVRGILLITVEDSGRIAGRWQLEQIRPTSSVIGPQTGEGELVGMVTEAGFWIDLQPGNADNNVLLHGTAADNTFLGFWEYVGFPGVLGRGTFEAWKLEK